MQSPCLPGFQLQSPCLRAAVLWVSLLPGAARAPAGSSQEDSSALPPRKEPRLPSNVKKKKKLYIPLELSVRCEL